MFYTIYKITNTTNGKIYIGKHQTDNPNDGYMGSGKYIKAAIKKHGKENFTKEVLHVFETEAEMNIKEKELITEEFVSRNDTYNAGVGGEGGPHFKGKRHSPESRKKMATFGKVLTEEARNKISEANRKRKFSEETKRKLSDIAKARYSGIKKVKPEKQKYVMTEQHKAKIALSVKNSGSINSNVVENVVCPHCFKEGQKLAMSRHHFNNCKLLREGQDG
jgi:hypothetical protein